MLKLPYDVFTTARIAIRPRGDFGLDMVTADHYAKDFANAVEVSPEMRANATQAVLEYFKAHSEAGNTPLFHHREGLAKAVLATLFDPV